METAAITICIAGPIMALLMLIDGLRDRARWKKQDRTE
jgi:hypothetical protein